MYSRFSSLSSSSSLDVHFAVGVHVKVEMSSKRYLTRSDMEHGQLASREDLGGLFSGVGGNC